MKATIETSGKTIYQHLTQAKENGLLYPSITIDKFTFTLAPATGANYGCVYVKIKPTKQYLGKIGTDNRFYPVRETREEDCYKIAAIRDDLHGAMKVHGQKTGRCSCCGRLLTAESSINAMIGPICAEKFGF